MKYLYSILAILLLTVFQGVAAPVSDEMQRAVAEIRQAINLLERAETQSLEQLNAAAREQVIRELKLSASQRRKFEPLYNAYRTALDNAVTPVSGIAGGDAEQRQDLKAKLANIAATAQVKRDYVDKFAAILSAEQIRQLYNTEGAISTSIKREAGNRMPPRMTRLKGSGRMVTQDWGAAGNYTGISAGVYCSVTLSPSARTVTVTADDNIIDYISMQNEGGVLGFRFNSNSNSIENIHIEITVPLSLSLNSIKTSSYGKVVAAVPLKAPAMKVDISSYGSVTADIETSGATQVSASSYGRFKGSVRCGTANYTLSSYAKAEGPVECRETCQMQLSSYARFSDDVKASRFTLAQGSYSKFAGAVSVSEQAGISLGSYSSFSGAFSCSSLTAGVGSYASMTLTGSAQVVDVKVSLSYSSSFNAPDLRVVNYDIKASNYSKCDVWCSGTLRIDAPLQARITYDGPCKLEAYNQNIRRKQ